MFVAVLGLAVAAATAVGHARFGVLPGPVLVVVYGWSAVWFGVGIVARRVRTHSSVGISMMLFGIGEMVAAAAASYVGSGPAFTVLRTAGVLVNGVQMAWLLHLAMTLLRLRATPRTAQTRAIVTWSYGALYALGLLLTDDPATRGTLAAGWVLLLATLVTWMSVRWLGSPTRLRRVRGAPTLVAVVTATLALVMAVDATIRGVPVWPGSVRAAAPGGGGPLDAVAEVTFWLSLVAIPGAFLFELVRQRVALARVADLVAHIGAVPVRELEPALAEALGDPRLHLVLDAAAARPAAPGRVVSDVGPGVLLVHDPSLLEERRLLDAVRAVVALALERDGLRTKVAENVEEIRASRARLVAAADEARRRLERDLHDGAQQRLLSAGLALRAAEASLPENARPALAEAQAEVRAASAELRDLARGIHPQVLTALGLPAALDHLAGHAPLTVRVFADGVGRLPASVEAAAYFVVAEALANVAKHARASVVDVNVHSGPGSLTVRVADDGVGGARPEPGSGLTGLHDRLAAVDGWLELESPPGGGTTLTAHIPHRTQAGSGP